MSGIIIFPYGDPWIVSGRAYVTLINELILHLEEPEDLATVEVALAIHGLHLDKMPAEQAARVAQTLAKVADDLRLRLRSMPGDDTWSHSYADLLGELEMALHDLYE